MTAAAKAQKMKKVLLLFCMILVAQFASAYYTAYIDGIYYNIGSTSASVVSKDLNYNSYAGDIVIPESIDYNGKTYPVNLIDMHAFYDCTGLTSITIPSSVKSIFPNAFKGCTKLKRVNICDLSAWCKINFSTPESNPIYYGADLYINGEKPVNIVIPEGLTYIGAHAFYGYSSLKSVNIPTSVTSINSYAFSGCKGLTEVNIPSSVTYIGNWAFYGCTGLTSINIPASVKSSKLGAFTECTNIKSVYISNLSAWCNISFAQA